MLADTELDKTILREAASGRPTAAAHFSGAVVVFRIDERILALDVVRCCARPAFALERLTDTGGRDGKPEHVRSTLPRHSRGQWIGPGRNKKATAADAQGTRARRRFGKGFRVALRPLGTQKESPTRGPRCSEANQHPSHACGCAIDRPILWAMVLLWTASFETILLYAGEGLGIFSLLTVAAVSLASIAAGVPCYYLTAALKRV